MKYNDFMSKYGVIEKYDGRNESVENLENVVGKQVWICDYRLNDAKDFKPIRHVEPQLVEVFGLDSLPSNKRVYYSNIYFRPISKGKLLAKIISPVDNTGYRGRPGTSLNIFETEKECIDCYKKQVTEAIKEFSDKVVQINSHIEELKKL